MFGGETQCGLVEVGKFKKLRGKQNTYTVRNRERFNTKVGENHVGPVLTSVDILQVI